MGRKARFHAPGTMYHAIQKGFDKKILFRNDIERQAYLEYIKEDALKFNIRLHAFSLLDNQVHLLVQVSDQPLAKFIHTLASKYTRYANHRRHQTGSLFNGRYRAELIPTTRRLAELAAKLHSLPVEKKFTDDPRSYEWSSHRHYLQVPSPPWLTVKTVLGHCSEDENEARILFDISVKNLCLNEKTEKRHKRDFPKPDFEIGDAHEQREGISLDLLIDTVCREYGINTDQLSSPGKNRHLSEARAMVALLVLDTSAYTLNQASEFLGRDASTLSSAARRLRSRVKKDSDVLKRLNKIKILITAQPPVEMTNRFTIKKWIDENGSIPLNNALEIIYSLIEDLEKQTKLQYPLIQIDSRAILIDEKFHTEILPGENTRVFADESPGYDLRLISSLGSLLFEMITGFKPCSDSDGGIDIRRYGIDLPESVELLIHRMLEPDHDFRITNPRSLREDLAFLLDKSDRIATDISEAKIDISKTLSRDMPVVRPSILYSSIPFIGREQEIRTLLNHFSRAETRLITLLGPGGVGKSRLAFEYSRKISLEFKDGAIIVPLTVVYSPYLIPLAVGNELDIQFRESMDIEKQLFGYLRSKEMLIVLDDFDLLIEGGDFISRLIAETAYVKVLVTSREKLRIPDEQVVEISGLETPVESGDKPVETYSSVRLFVACAQRLKHRFKPSDSEEMVVAKICRLLEGMPLAIELSAGWIRVMDTAEILHEIFQGLDSLATTEHDIPERHQSIRAAFDRSWRMLDNQERNYLMMLSVFHGGFTREAAEVIADVSFPRLMSFLDKSLLHRNPTGRFVFHNLLKQFIQEKSSSAEVDMEQVRRAHSIYFAKESEKLRPVFGVRGSFKTLEEMETELPNIREGYIFSVKIGANDLIDCYTRTVSHYYMIRGMNREALDFTSHIYELFRTTTQCKEGHTETTRRILAKLLIRIAAHNRQLGRFCDAEESAREALSILEMESRDDSELVYVLEVLGHVLLRQGKNAEAEHVLNQALSHAEQTKDIRQAAILDHLGTLSMLLGRYKESELFHSRSLELLRQLDDSRGMAVCLNNLGNVLYCQGKFPEAEGFYREASEINDKLGYLPGLRISLSNLGNTLCGLARLDEARIQYKECLELSRKIGSDHAIAHSLYQLSELALGSEDGYDEAERLAKEALVIHRKTGQKRGQGLVLYTLGLVSTERGDLTCGRTLIDESIEIFRSIDEQWGLARSLRALGRILLNLDDSKGAMDSFLESLEISTRIGAEVEALSTVNALGEYFREQGNTPRAIRLFRYVVNHPSAAAETRSKATNNMEILLQNTSEILQQQLENDSHPSLSDLAEELTTLS